MRRKNGKIILAVMLAFGLLLSGIDSTALQAEAAGKKVTVKLNKTKASVKKGRRQP